MKMTKYTAAILFAALLCAPPPAMAFLQEVHDSVITSSNFFGSQPLLIASL